MTLKARLLLGTTVTTLAILGASECLSYFTTAAFVNGHETAMAQVGHHASLLADLERGKHDLLRNLVWLHLAHAALTVLGLIGVLQLLWWRLFLSPLDSILKHIRAMGLGTWTNPIPIERSDEVGDLIRAFNSLGDQLAAAVEQVAITSRLSAVALVGGRMARKAVSIRDRVRSVELLLAAVQREQDLPQTVILRLSEIGADLDGIRTEFEAAFAHEFETHSVCPQGVQQGNRSLVL